mgnify:CR=1 FL=1
MQERHELWLLAVQRNQIVRHLDWMRRHIAQAFNAFYHRYPVLNEERADARLWRAAGVAYFRRQLTSALGVMGIAVPSRM